MQPDAPLRRTIDVEHVGTTRVLVLPQDASLEVAEELRVLLREATGDVGGTIVVDLSTTTFVDSRTLGALLESMKRLRPHGGQLHVVVGKREVRRIFEITLLDRAFPVHATRAEALAAIAIAATPTQLAAGQTPEDAA